MVWRSGYSPPAISSDPNLWCASILYLSKLQGHQRITSSSSPPDLRGASGLFLSSRWDFQFIEGRSEKIARRVDSPLWWANLLWPLVPSPAWRVQITVLQSGDFVTVEFCQRQIRWTRTPTTGGITPLHRGPVRWIDAIFCRHWPVTVERNWDSGVKKPSRVEKDEVSCNWKVNGLIP